MALPDNKGLKVTTSDALEFEPVVPEPPKRRLGLKAFMFLVVAAAGACTCISDRCMHLQTGACTCR